MLFSPFAFLLLTLIGFALIPVFHYFDPAKHMKSIKPASLRDRVIAQLIDSILLSVICSAIIFLFSKGKIYSLWIAPIIPQFILEVPKDFQSNPANFWWGGYFFSIRLPYGKDILLNYPAPILWLVYCLYYVSFTIFKNQTPGKMMKGLVILTTNPESNISQTSISVFTSLCRWAGYYLALIPIGFGFWRVNFGKNNKSWQDKICKTQVYYFE